MGTLAMIVPTWLCCRYPGQPRAKTQDLARCLGQAARWYSWIKPPSTSTRRI